MARWPSRSGSGLARSIASQTNLAESQHCHFAFVAELFMCGPPVGGTFWFQIFIQAPSPEIWSETISGGEEVLAGKWGGLFWGASLLKIFGEGVSCISSPPVFEVSGRAVLCVRTFR